MIVGDYGQQIAVSNDLNLSASTAVRLSVERPDGSTFSHDYTAPSIPLNPDGSITYTVVAGDLTVDGNYSAQIIDLTSGRTIQSSVFEFYVGRALPVPTS